MSFAPQRFYGTVALFYGLTLLSVQAQNNGFYVLSGNDSGFEFAKVNSSGNASILLTGTEEAESGIVIDSAGNLLFPIDDKPPKFFNGIREPYPFDKIMKVTPNGTRSTFSLGTVDNIRSLGTDHDGKLFVSGSSGTDESSGIYQVEAAGATRQITKVDGGVPMFAFDAQNNLFAVHFLREAIFKVTISPTAGLLPHSYVVAGHEPWPGLMQSAAIWIDHAITKSLERPFCIACGPDGNFYVGGGADGRTIYRITPAGSVSIFAEGPSGGLTFDTQGHLFACADSTIYLVSPTGAFTPFATFRPGLYFKGFAIGSEFRLDPKFNVDPIPKIWPAAPSTAKKIAPFAGFALILGIVSLLLYRAKKKKPDLTAPA